MLTLGTLTCDRLGRTSERKVAGGHETVAVLTEAVPVSGGEGSGGPAKAEARWRLPNGTTRTGLVEAQEGSKAGAEVDIWLDRSGNPMDAPLSAADIAAVGVLVVVFGWLGAVGLLAGFCVGLHHLLDRHRYRTWDAEWARGEPGWHGQTR